MPEEQKAPETPTPIPEGEPAAQLPENSSPRKSTSTKRRRIDFDWKSQFGSAGGYSVTKRVILGPGPETPSPVPSQPKPPTGAMQVVPPAPPAAPPPEEIRPEVELAEHETQAGHGQEAPEPPTRLIPEEPEGMPVGESPAVARVPPLILRAEDESMEGAVQAALEEIRPIEPTGQQPSSMFVAEGQASSEAAAKERLPAVEPTAEAEALPISTESAEPTASPPTVEEFGEPAETGQGLASDVLTPEESALSAETSATEETLPTSPGEEGLTPAPTPQPSVARVCPYLGLRGDRHAHFIEPSETQVCYSPIAPGAVDVDYQRQNCFSSDYSLCKRFTKEGEGNRAAMPVPAIAAPALATTAGPSLSALPEPRRRSRFFDYLLWGVAIVLAIIAIVAALRILFGNSTAPAVPPFAIQPTTTPSLTATLEPTSVVETTGMPTLAPLVIPIPAANQVVLDVLPDPGLSGWTVDNESEPHWGDALDRDQFSPDFSKKIAYITDNPGV